MLQTEMRSDGSSPQDTCQIVRIERRDEVDRMRFRCPNGHTRWVPTNSHAYCHSCAESRTSDPEVDPEHYELLDAKTDELIDWSRIELVE